MAETPPPATTKPPEPAPEKLFYYPIHPRMRLPYLICGYVFVVLSVLLIILQIINPEPTQGHSVLVMAMFVFSAYLIYTANTPIKKVDDKHAGVQFWISLGAACGFITLSLCVAWILAKIITS